MEERDFKLYVLHKMLVITGLISTSRLNPGKDLEDIVGHGITSTFLHVIALGQVVEVFYEIENKTEIEDNKYISEVFKELPDKVKKFIESEYITCNDRSYSKIKNSPIPDGIIVFPELKEILGNIEGIIGRFLKGDPLFDLKMSLDENFYAEMLGYLQKELHKLVGDD